MTIDPVQVLSDRFRAAFAAAFPDRADAREADPLLAPSRNPAFGDFQSNAAMPLAKVLGRNPREVAKDILAKLELGDLCEELGEDSIAGPGFINLRLRKDALSSLLRGLDTPGLGIEPATPPKTIVVDLCGVNLAKQMHVGHLRSIIIGDALARTLERIGHRVIRQNHVGDWGLPIAMVTRALMDAQAGDALSPAGLTLDELERRYRAAQRACEADERGLAAAKRWWHHPKAVAELEEQVAGARESLERAKRTLVDLQRKEPATHAVWRMIAEITMRACLETCVRLNAVVTEEHSAGESYYADALADMVSDLASRGVAEESDGALVVRVEGIAEPAIVRKSDGGYLYATTDIAAIRHRVQKLGAERVIYCVDARQGLHFRQIFAAARKAGYDLAPSGEHAVLEHAGFGTVLGEDNRPFKTRSGDNIKLSDLLDEAEERAAAVVAAKSPELDESQRASVAHAVALAAIRYADLSSDRIKDYVFSFDRMLAFEGNTGPYLLYALVRLSSILRKAEAAGHMGAEGADSRELSIETTEEKGLALALLRYPGTLKAVATTLEPHRLCQFLYDLAGAFSTFFTNCPVLQAPDEATRTSRLALCALTKRVLADGLETLGLITIERM